MLCWAACCPSGWPSAPRSGPNKIPFGHSWAFSRPCFVAQPLQNVQLCAGVIPGLTRNAPRLAEKILRLAFPKGILRPVLAEQGIGRPQHPHHDCGAGAEEGESYSKA